MASLSDMAFQAAMAAYLVALICYGIELAARRTSVPAAAVREAVLVGTGTRPEPGERELDDEQDDGDHRRQVEPLGVRFGRAAVLVTVIGVVANAVSVVARGIGAGRLPLGNMYEFTSAFCLIAVVTWLVVLAKTGARSLGTFVLVPVVILAFLAGTVLWAPIGPLQPSLNSYWKWVHVTTVSLSGSVLLVSGAASVMYLLRCRHDAKAAARGSRAVADAAPAGEGDAAVASTSAPSAADGETHPMWSRLPSAELLDKVAYRTAIVAFPVYTFAIIAGALWAEVAWGRYWNWDPKETVAFVSWVFYAGYLHARATVGWRGVRAAWINAIGFAAIIFNLFFVNMVITGLHSYAGVG